MVAQLSPEFTKVLVNRWDELENQSPRAPTSYIEALEALIVSDMKLPIKAELLLPYLKKLPNYL
ncbi:MAG: hypothetical protein ACWIPH_04790 [Ostreibacterium sp.]